MQNKFKEKDERSLSMSLNLFHTGTACMKVKSLSYTGHVLVQAHGRLTQFSSKLCNEFRNNLRGNFV
jgi:hypothetical protein